MRNRIDSLDRLIRAARRGPFGGLEPPPGFEMRILTLWREQTPEHDPEWILTVAQRAFVAACGVVLLCLVFGHPGSSLDMTPNHLTLADSLIKASLLP